MLDVKDLDHFIDVMTFAAQEGCTSRLLDRLQFLSNYGDGPGPQFGPWQLLDQLAWILTHEPPGSTVCELYPDFAPHSFAFVIKHGEDGKTWFNGGLIYSGPGQPLDGSFPALTVDIGSSDAKHDWSVHT